MGVSFLNLKFIAPLAAALAMGVSIPVMAAAHAKPSGEGHQKISVSHPTKAASVPTLQVKIRDHGNASEKIANSLKSNHKAALSPTRTTVQADTTTIHSLLGQIHTARLQYVAALKGYIAALSTAMSSANSGSLSAAMTQIPSLNATLAQAVKNEMQTNISGKMHARVQGANGLRQVITKFQAELSALQKATLKLNAMTAKLSASGSGSTSGTRSVSGS